MRFEEARWFFEYLRWRRIFRIAYQEHSLLNGPGNHYGYMFDDDRHEREEKEHARRGKVHKAGLNVDRAECTIGGLLPDMHCLRTTACSRECSNSFPTRQTQNAMVTGDSSSNSARVRIGPIPRLSNVADENPLIAHSRLRSMTLLIPLHKIPI